MIRVYTLHSSEFPSDIRYVGITSKELDQRLGGHRRDCKKQNTKRSIWERSVIEAGHHLCIELLEEVELDGWKRSEKFWISQMRAWGFNLLNQTSGGNGTMGFRHNAETQYGNEREKTLRRDKKTNCVCEIGKQMRVSRK
jgi:hypothetical protein